MLAFSQLVVCFLAFAAATYACPLPNCGSGISRRARDTEDAKGKIVDGSASILKEPQDSGNNETAKVPADLKNKDEDIMEKKREIDSKEATEKKPEEAASEGVAEKKPEEAASEGVSEKKPEEAASEEVAEKKPEEAASEG
ncbi:unnamed protein product, partial [Enterobius vermicularis]|uniref:Secreted protein n=1 Tax=Enterobius vermicularis TaxID=51028 RepID=A0A0N4V4G4_ENTVE